MNSLNPTASDDRFSTAAPLWSGSTAVKYGIIVSALVLSYWPTIRGLLVDWRGNDDYSVGALVPIAFAFVVWNRRRELFKLPLAPCAMLGAVAVLLAQLVRFAGLLYLVESVERYSLVLTIMGLALWLLGMRITWALRWPLVFLFLMAPLPGRVHNFIAGPLQSVATSGAVFGLELLGVGVVREGHVLVVEDSAPLAVAEACSGLRMLTAFVVVGGVMAFLTPAGRWAKAALVISAVPVAILCNLIRLVSTALLFFFASAEFAERFFHDFAGWTMMPMAVAFLYLELRWMRYIANASTQSAAPGFQVAAHPMKFHHSQSGTT